MFGQINIRKSIKYLFYLYKNCCLRQSQNVGEIDRRLSQLASVANHLDDFHHQLNDVEQLMESSEREIEGYKQCLNVDDLEAVRNSYKVCIFLSVCNKSSRS